MAVKVWADSPEASLRISKQYSIERPMPMVNDYVRYDVTITNESDIPIENQTLWVTFLSENGITSVHTAFKIAQIPPRGESELHIGPFKMREAGEHALYLGINSQGNSSLANEVSLNFDPTEAVDRITVAEAAESSNAGFSVLAASSAVALIVIALIVVYRRRKNS